MCERQSVWGHGGYRESEMDKREGLRWLTEPVYISNGTLLWEGCREGKSALQTKHSRVYSSFFFILPKEVWWSHILCPSSIGYLKTKKEKKNLLYWCKCISLSFSVFSETADWENLWPFFPISFGIYCVFHLGTGHLRRVCWDFCFDPEEDDWSITLKAEWLGRGRQTRGQFCSRGVLGSSLWSTVFLQKPLNLLFTWQILLALCSRCLSLRQGGSSKSLDAGNCERVQRQTEQWRGKEKWSVFCLVAAVDTLRARCWQRQSHQHRCRV